MKRLASLLLLLSLAGSAHAQSKPATRPAKALARPAKPVARPAAKVAPRPAPCPAYRPPRTPQLDYSRFETVLTLRGEELRRTIAAQEGPVPALQVVDGRLQVSLSKAAGYVALNLTPAVKPLWQQAANRRELLLEVEVRRRKISIDASAGIAWRDSAVEERGINLDWFTGESCENRFSSYNPRGGEAPSGDLAPDGAAPVSHTIGWLLRRDTLRVVADGLVRGHFSKQHTPDRSGRDNRQLILDLSASAGQVIEITQVRFSLGREALSLREQVAAQAAARPARLELVADATPSDLLREQETSYTRKMEVKENRLEVSSSDTASYGGNWNSTLAIPSRLLQAINERLPGQAVMLEVTSQVLGANPKGLSQLQLNCHTTPFSADVSLAFDARQPGWNFHFHGQEPLMSGPIIGAPSRGHTWGLLLRNDSAHVYVDDRPQGRWVSVRPWLQAVQKGGMSRLELELEGQRPEIIVVHTVRVYGQDETRVVAARKAAAEALATKQEAEKHARLLAEAQTRQAAEQASRLAAEKRAAEERAASSSASRSSYSSSSGSSSSSSGGISFSRADMSAFSKTTVCLALLRADNTIRSIECFEYPSGTSKAEAVQRARNSLGISEETGVYYSTSSCGTASESAKSYFRNAGGYRTTVTCH